MNVPKLRFGEFEDEWQDSTLGDVSKVTSGGTPNRANNEFWNGSIPWVSTALIDFNVIKEADEFITEDGLNNSSAKLFPKNTLLMAMYGQGKTRGKVAILGIEAATNQACAAIMFNEEVDTNFAFHNLSGRYDEIRELSNAGSQENLSAGLIKELNLSYPQITEQQKIADFLSAVDEKITALTAQKTALTQYKQGMMQRIFSQTLRFKNDNGADYPEWEVKYLKNVSAIYDGTHMTPDYQASGVPFYSVEHVTSDNFNDTKFISAEVFEKECKRVKIEKNDILMTRIGDIGTSKLIDWDVKASFYVSLALIKPFTTTVGAYLDQYIRSSYFQRELYQRTIHVAFPKKINLGEIGECVVKLPNFDEQTKIAQLLTELDDKINAVDAQIQSAQQWKQGLLQQMFV